VLNEQRQTGLEQSDSTFVPLDFREEGFGRIGSGARRMPFLKILR
jgi:hypothetical protein